jgi:cold shock protein
LTQREKGQVKWFDISKGYGYIDAGLEEDVFVYFKELREDNLKILLQGDQVEFELQQGVKGPEAVLVKKLH